MAHLRRARGVKSRKTWTGNGFDPARGTFSDVLPDNHAAFVHYGGVTDEDVTILRTRGVLAVVVKTAATSGFYMLGIGMGIVSGRTAEQVAPESQLPRALLDDDWDGWFVHQIVQGGRISEAAGQQPTGYGDTVIDSKAMRIIEGDNAIFLSVEIFNGTPDVTNSIDYQVYFRGLLKTN